MITPNLMEGLHNKRPKHKMSMLDEQNTPNGSVEPIKLNNSNKSYKCKQAYLFKGDL